VVVDLHDAVPVRAIADDGIVTEVEVERAGRSIAESDAADAGDGLRRASRRRGEGDGLGLSRPVPLYQIDGAR
jgi:hypothetical protein